MSLAFDDNGDTILWLPTPDGGVYSEIVVAGDAVRFEPGEGFRVDRETKMPATWIADEWRAKLQAERDSRVASYVEQGHGDLVRALSAYVETTDHDYGCASYSEGLMCCLDPEHERFGQLLAVLTGNAESAPHPEG
jgi:hypothetical protein